MRCSIFTAFITTTALVVAAPVTGAAAGSKSVKLNIWKSIEVPTLDVTPAGLSGLVDDLKLDAQKVADLFGIETTDEEAGDVVPATNRVLAFTPESLHEFSKQIEVPFDTLAVALGLSIDDEPLSKRDLNKRDFCWSYYRRRCMRFGTF